MIKLIMFDLGNVFLKKRDVICDDVGEKLAKISYESIYDSTFNKELNKIANELRTDEIYLKERLIKYFRDKYQPTISIQEIQSLKCKYKLGIASNFISNIYDSLDNYKEYFDIVCISGAIECEKPNKDFYQKFMDEAYYHGIFAREILFIDDKQENLQAARELGLNTMHYNNEDEGSLSLYQSIIKFIEKMETDKENIDFNNEIINHKLNKNATRNAEILIPKIQRQKNAMYSELCVGAIPVLDTYGFKPTKPTKPSKPPLEALKELDDERKNEDIYFLEELLLSLSDIKLPYKEEDLYPIYILLSFGATTVGKVIKKATKEPYSHSSISFTSDLSQLYSFTGKGFVKEDIKDKDTYARVRDYKYSLYTIFVNKNQIKSMIEALNGFISRAKDFTYSRKGLVKIFFGQESHYKDSYFCSQFVSELIKIGDASRIKKDPSLYTPYDLRKIKDCFFIQKGFLRNYNPKEVERKTKIIKNNLKNPIMSEGIVRNFFDLNDEALILRYKRLDFNEEYNKSHKLLKIYAKTNDLESMKEELAKLWSYYLIIEELYIQKAKKFPELKNTKDYKDAVKAKAFILGDIKEYLNYISKYETYFNFAEYYSQSKYNKDVIRITHTDIKNIIKLINKIL